jgi:hypothetical protein
MIEPTSLRLGNLVELCGQYYQVCTISKDHLQITSKGAHIGGLDFKFEDINPIPLTEELLLQFGGIKNDRASYPSYNLNGLLIDFIKGKWIEYVTQIEIKGAHHLQNVVYFRTNQELTKIDKK